MDKDPTRFRVDVIDANGDIAWSVLRDHDPASRLVSVLLQHGYHIERTNDPTGEIDFPMWSALDPINSIIAGINFKQHRSHCTRSALIVLLNNMPDWVTPEQIRAGGGGSESKKRYRDLRQQGWPVDQLRVGKGAWPMRMIDKDGIYDAWARLNDDPGTLF